MVARLTTLDFAKKTAHEETVFRQAFEAVIAHRFGSFPGVSCRRKRRPQPAA